MIMIWGCDTLRRVSLNQDSDAQLEKCIKSGKGSQGTVQETLSSDAQNENVPEENEEVYDTVIKKQSDLSSGTLALVNQDHEYVFPENESGLVKMADDMNRDNYKLAYMTYLLDPEALSEFNRMMQDFHGVHQANDVTVYEAYKSYSAQNDSYTKAGASSSDILINDNYIPAGASEHHTGYALDLILVNGSSITKFDGTGDYEWITKNCYKYGFILRYPEHKEEETKMAYQPAHFRYVGIPHSYIMNEKDYSLEEYISELKQYDFNGEHLKYSLNGNDYQIYYVKSTADSTSVPVVADPDKKVVISGNNEDGFIVTVKSKSVSENTSVTQGTSETVKTEKSDCSDTQKLTD